MGSNIRILMVKWHNCPIGYLMKEEGVGYLYKYDTKGMKIAKNRGYKYLMGFKDTRKTYASKELFPTFKSRVPTSQRRDLEEKLSLLGIDHNDRKFDEFDYLAASKGELYSDPITVEEIYEFNKKLKRIEEDKYER